MKAQTPIEAAYKATLMPEHALSLLDLLLPAIPQEQKEEFLNKGKERQRTPADCAADGTASYVDCILLPYLPSPILFLKDGQGKVKGLEFRVHASLEAFDVYELSPGMAREYFDLHYNPQCLALISSAGVAA